MHTQGIWTCYQLYQGKFISNKAAYIRLKQVHIVNTKKIESNTVKVRVALQCSIKNGLKLKTK